MSKFGGSGKKPHLADKRKRERFRKKHSEGRKQFAKNKKNMRLKTITI